MAEKKKYRVLITETRQKAVIVEAENEQEAHRRAQDAWMNTEVVLSDQDHCGTEFHVVGEAQDADGLQKVIGKE